jgi:hypothetical protein
MARKAPARRYHNVPVLESTWARLRDYRVGSQTYDEVLNRLMDSVPLEMVTEDVLREHRRRLATFEGRDWREAMAGLERRRGTVPRPRGPARRKAARRPSS